jgi:hypothetical protein
LTGCKELGEKKLNSPFYNLFFFFVQFADSPEIRSRPGNVEADIGSNVTLRCDVNGNPEPEISWTYEGSRRVLSTGPAYTFWMNHDMAGKYTCTARVPGFTEVSADAHVFLKGDIWNRFLIVMTTILMKKKILLFSSAGPPTVRSKRIQFGLEGDTVRIECVAFAVPRPSKITWTHRGYEIDAGKYQHSKRQLVPRKLSV